MKKINRLLPFEATKKPVTIEAVLWTGGNIETIDAFVANTHEVQYNNLLSSRDQILKVWNGLEGQWINCPIGHYIIKGVAGEFYPCEPKVFDKTYNVVGEDT